MKNIQPNAYGVIVQSDIVQQHIDNYIDYKIRKAVYNNEEYYASSVTINGFGIYSGSSGGVSIHIKSSLENEISWIKKFLTRELANSDNGKKHLSKLELFQKTQQLSLF